MSFLSNTIMFCFCGPTGSGKSTICRELLKRDPQLTLSISTTTRTPRVGEVEGKDYYFVTREEFERRVKSDSFVEYAEVSGNLYGTERRNFDLCRSSNRDLLLDIDYHGAAAFKKAYPAETVVLFVFPPSFIELKNRLAKRGDGESAEHRAARLKLATQEISALTQPGFSDYLLLNGELEATIESALGIVTAERRRLVRIPTKRVLQITGE